MGYQLPGRILAIARLCLTYTDIFGCKHASMFDYTFDHKWVPIAFPRAIDADLMDLNFRRWSRSRTLLFQTYGQEGATNQSAMFQVFSLS